MGASSITYWMSWFISFMTNITIISLASCLILKYGGVFPYSEGLPVFILLWLYGLSMFGYSILISSFFTKPALASMVATLLFFISSFVD